MLKQLGNNPKMTALYYRTARKETDSLHLDNQMHKLLCYASEQGICNFKLYADIGVNGLTLDRPAFNSLKADIDAGLIDRLIIRDISRIARDFILTGQFIEWAQSQGVVIIGVLDGLEIKPFAPSADFTAMITAAYRSLPKGGKRA